MRSDPPIPGAGYRSYNWRPQYDTEQTQQPRGSGRREEIGTRLVSVARRRPTRWDERYLPLGADRVHAERIEIDRLQRTHIDIHGQPTAHPVSSAGAESTGCVVEQ